MLFLSQLIVEFDVSMFFKTPFSHSVSQKENNLQAQGQVPVQSLGPKKGKRNLASGLVTKILWATTHHPTQPHHPTHNF